MRSTIYVLLIGASFFMTACSRSVTRVDPNQQIDLSGSWNNTDSRLVAEEMTKSILGDRWLSNFQDAHKGAKPVVIVGMVQNTTHEHIDAEAFIRNIEVAFTNSGMVRLVQGGKFREEVRGERADQQTNASQATIKKFGLENGADYMLQGSITSIVDAIKRNKVVYYQTDLTLTDMQSNEIVWVGEKKIAKQVKN